MERLIKAGGYSLAGLKSAWAREAAFRQEVVLAVFMIPLGLYLGDTGLERAMLIGAVLLVLIVELINSALESAVDRIGSDMNPLSKAAKDIGSAAVFVSLVNGAAVWALILI